jgi:ElaB/YqjD/DUF883 family membrane-anchored ribosome-binding protein
MTSWIEGEWNKVTSGANAAPTPQVNSSPAATGTPHTWKSPDVSHPGHLHVNTSHLTTAADVMKACLPELNAAVDAVNQQLDAFSSLSGWQAAEEMRTRLQNLVQQVTALGQERSTVQTKAALDLTRSADEYDEKEAAIKQAFNGIGPAVNAGSAPKTVMGLPYNKNTIYIDKAGGE